MEELRNWLLQHDMVDLYEQVLQFISAPAQMDSKAIIDKAPSEIASVLANELNEIMCLYATDRDQYQHTYTFGQEIIWREIINTYLLLKKQNEIIEHNNLVKTIEKQRDDALSSNEASLNKLKDNYETITKQDKTIAQLSNDINKLEDDLKKQHEIIEQFKAQIKDLSLKEQEIAELKIELSKAVEQAYTDDVLKRLSSDVLDELAAVSLGGQEILKIAKQRFSQNETIQEGWDVLSKESNTIIEQILSEFDIGVFSEKQLDLLEQLEDGILIRYAVTKALKAILYNALEKQETTETIGERFGGNN